MQVSASGLAKSLNNVCLFHVDVMRPVLVQKRRRNSMSQVVVFLKSFIEGLLRRTDHNIMGLLVEREPIYALLNMSSSVTLKQHAEGQCEECYTMKYLGSTSPLT